MGFLDLGDLVEAHRNLTKSFGLGHLAETGIQIHPLVVLALARLFEVLQRRADDPGRIRCRDLDHASFQELEINLGMPQFVVYGLFEKVGDFFITVLAGLFRIHAVTVGGLRFPGERLQQVLFGQTADQISFFHNSVN